MLLLLGLACAAARAPTSLRVFNDEGLEPAPANGTTPPVSINTDGQFVANDITIREAVSLLNSVRTSLPVPRTSSLGPTRSGTDSTTSTSTAGPVRGSRT